MRDSIIFYRSFYDAIKEMDQKHQAIIYNAIFEYSLNFKEIELTGLPKTIFTLIKPQLDANIRRFENGSKGGRKSNQNETEKKPKNNQNETEIEANNNNNVNVNNNDNVNEEMWTSIKKTFLEDGTWQYKFCTQKDISLVQFDKLMKEFISGIELKEDYKPLPELKKHFTNLFEKNKRNGNSIKTTSSVGEHITFDKA